MGSTHRGPDVGTLPGALFFRHRRASSMAQARTRLPGFWRSPGWVFFGICVALVLMSQTPTAAADAQTNRIRIEYYPPNNPALKGYLPKERANSCKREYDQVAFAFRDLIVPHLDQQLARQVMDKTWLPEVKARSSRN